MHSNRLALVGRLLAALLMMLTLGIAAAAAQADEAPYWIREGVNLAQGETHYITTKVYNVTGKEKGFTLAAAGKTIHCESVRLKEGSLVGSNPDNSGTLSEVIEFFGGCAVTGNGSSCKPIEPIRTNTVEAELVDTEKGEKGSLLADFKPEKGVKFTTIKFEGSACTVKETAVEGEVAGQVRTDPNDGEVGELVTSLNKEAQSWLLNFPAAPIKEVWLIKEGIGSEVKLKGLNAFAESATLTGTALLTLAKRNSGGEFEAEEANWGFNLGGTPVWNVKGAKLVKAESIMVKPVTVTYLKNGKIEVECKKATTGTGIITETVFFVMTNITLEECEVLKPVENPGVEKCIVEGGKIELLGKQQAGLRWAAKIGEGALIEFYRPLEVTKFKLKAEASLKCTAIGEYKAIGESLAELKNASTEEKSKKFLFKCPRITSWWLGEEPNRRERMLQTPLEIGEAGKLEKGEICGEYEVELSGGNAKGEFSAKKG